MSTATITRKLVDFAYPRNGNLGNPTPRFRWEVEVDGQVVSTSERTLARAKAFAAEYYGATSFKVVREPLPANPWTLSGSYYR